MKAVISRDRLVTMLGIVQRVALNKGTFPVLEGVLLDFSGDTARLACTDLELSIEAFLRGVEIEESGVIVVPVRGLAGIVKQLGNDVFFEGDGRKLIIRSGVSVFEMNALPVEEFPEFPQVDGRSSLSIPGESFQKLVQETIFAVSKEEAKPILMGVFLESKDGVLSAVATDSYRMAWSQANVNAEGDFEVIVPPKALQEMAKVISTDMTIAANESLIKFATPNVTLVARTIQGRYPNFRGVIPDTESIVEVSRQELINAIERVAAIGYQEKIVDVKMQVESERMIVSVDVPGVGKAHDVIECKLYATPFELKFRDKYLLDGLKVMQKEKVTIGFTGQKSPFIVRPVQDIEYQYFVAPMVER